LRQKRPLNESLLPGRWPSSSRDLSAATIPGAALGLFQRVPEHPDLGVVQGPDSLSQALGRIIEDLDESGDDAETVANLKADRPTPYDLRRTLATGMARLGFRATLRRGLPPFVGGAEREGNR
jgi:hypothetical protein